MKKTIDLYPSASRVRNGTYVSNDLKLTTIVAILRDIVDAFSEGMTDINKKDPLTRVLEEYGMGVDDISHHEEIYQVFDAEVERLREDILGGELFNPLINLNNVRVRVRSTFSTLIEVETYLLEPKVQVIGQMPEETIYQCKKWLETANEEGGNYGSEVFEALDAFIAQAGWLDD